ncbi:MAG: YidH family protein [Pseudonocardiaceae bacterium]
MERNRRWPSRVYGGGEEPDPRFSLANERTFLAWIRTTLALLAGAAAVEALDLPMPEQVQVFLAVLLALIGLVCALQAWRGWASTERAMRHRNPLPSNPVKVIVMVGVAVVAVSLVVVSLTGAG